MNRTLVATCLAMELASCRGLLPVEHPTRVVRGPLASRIHQPQALTYLAPTPRRAAVHPTGKLGVSWTSIYANIHELGVGPNIEVDIDGELWTNTLTLRQGLGRGVDFELQIPTLYTTSGFLDPFVQDFHSSLFLPNGGRGDAPDNQFAMDIVLDGERIASMEEDRFGLLDIPLFFTFALVEERRGRPAISLRAGVGLPTGSEDAGFGNGAFDFGVGLLAEQSHGRWTITGGASYTVNADPPGFEGSAASAADPLEVLTALEMRWTDRLSLLAQVDWSTRLVDGVQLKELDRDIVDLGLGVSYGGRGDTRWTLSFHEDLVAESAHDFLLLLAWSRGL